MCGWRDLADGRGTMQVRWRRLDGMDEISLNRSRGRYDHTYGASKHTGERNGLLFKAICLLLFYILASSTVMSGWVWTCDSAHS